MSLASNLPLQGKRILVVEDQALIALDLQATLEEDGAVVVGPFHGLGAAMHAASAELALDAAVLDVDLGQEDVFPLADYLAEHGVPFVFHTGHAEIERLHRRYEHVPVIAKPAPPSEVIGRLVSTITAAKTARARGR